MWKLAGCHGNLGKGGEMQSLVGLEPGNRCREMWLYKDSTMGLALRSQRYGVQ